MSEPLNLESATLEQPTTPPTAQQQQEQQQQHFPSTPQRSPSSALKQPTTPGWRAVLDKKGQVYYYHVATKRVLRNVDPDDLPEVGQPLQSVQLSAVQAELAQARYRIKELEAEVTALKEEKAASAKLVSYYKVNGGRETTFLTPLINNLRSQAEETSRILRAYEERVEQRRRDICGNGGVGGGDVQTPTGTPRECNVSLDEDGYPRRSFTPLPPPDILTVGKLERALSECHTIDAVLCALDEMEGECEDKPMRYDLQDDHKKNKKQTMNNDVDQNKNRVDVTTQAALSQLRNTLRPLHEINALQAKLVSTRKAANETIEGLTTTLRSALRKMSENGQLN